MIFQKIDSFKNFSNHKYMPKNLFNPLIHHRKSLRLNGYDYSKEGIYFITICCQNRDCRFGKIKNKEMISNEYGNTAYNEWVRLSERFSNFELYVFQIMPNHMHEIILLRTTTNVGAGFTPARMETQTGHLQNTQPNFACKHNVNTIQSQKLYSTQPHNVNNSQPHNVRIGQPQGIAPTIGDIVGAYKSLVTNGCLAIYKSKNETMGQLWQRNYYERIIRNEQLYQTISDYIINNPAKWQNDKFY